jgi:hypothetical protein
MPAFNSQSVRRTAFGLQKIARILTVSENNQGTRAQSPLGRTVQVRMTLQGDFMILTILNDTSFYWEVRFLSAKIGRAECTSLRSLRSPWRTLI